MAFNTEQETAINFLTQGLEEAERSIFLQAFYEFCRGDHKSFPVSSAVLQLAMAKLLMRFPDLVSSNVLKHQELVGKMAQAAAKLGSDTVQAREVGDKLVATEIALRNLVKNAVTDIDVSKLSQKLDAALLSTVAKTNEASAALVVAGQAATTQIARAQKATLIWSIPIIFLSAAILAGSIYFWQWLELKERDKEARVRAVQSYGDAYAVLASNGMALETFTTLDGATFVYVRQGKDAYKAADYHGCVIQIK